MFLPLTIVFATPWNNGKIVMLFLAISALRFSEKTKRMTLSAGTNVDPLWIDEAISSGGVLSGGPPPGADSEAH